MKKTVKTFILLLSLFSFNSLRNEAQAEINEYKIIIKNHQFNPPNLDVPCNKKVKLLIENQDKTAEEFESYDLNREKIVGGNQTVTIYIGPLKAGTYKYFGDFNPKKAQGTISCK